MQITFSQTIKEIKTNIIFVSYSDLIDILKKDNIIIVIDGYVYRNYQHLFEGINDRIIIINEKKGIKDFHTFKYICNELINKKATTNTHLYGIGGGEVTDLVGFVASVYLRGIKVNFVPTTLLAMVDASIGGKNAINIGSIKNAVGTIYHPQNVYINTLFLENCSQELLLGGFAEILKTGLLFDIKLLNDCLIFLDNFDFRGGQFPIVNDIIRRTISHKMKIIVEDNFNNRAFLNFGHTIGHILELDYDLPHGYAVAIGMIYESQIAVLLNLTDISIFNEIYRILTKYFKYNIEDYDLVKSADKLLLDKKVTGNEIKIPVIEEIGRAKLVEIKLNDFMNCINMKFNLSTKRN